MKVWRFLLDRHVTNQAGNRFFLLCLLLACMCVVCFCSFHYISVFLIGGVGESSSS